MSYATVQSCTLSGISALAVTVEVHISGGLPGMSIVGLPQSAVRESKDRVKAAIRHAGLKYPAVRIVVNLAPADLPKQGGRFDLPIALAILVASDQLKPTVLDNRVVLGELGLTGKVRPVTGVLPTALAYADSNTVLLIPDHNAKEAALGRCNNIELASDLATLVAQLQQSDVAQLENRVNEHGADQQNTTGSTAFNARPGYPDMQDVKGQAQARRALEIAAAGGHNLLMVGPPGTGKSMLASRLPGIQSAMTQREANEAASVASITHQGFDASQWGVRPFRSPHHTASGIALVGGGSKPMPGEISLAHNGVLFLDELTEFPRAVLDVLREPMETGHITISRAARQADFPARFQLIAAMNPCPCGFDGDPDHHCACTPDQIARYATRISGPFLDRIDLHINVPRLSRMEMDTEEPGESSAEVRHRVIAAQQVQLDRKGVLNFRLQGKQLQACCQLSKKNRSLLYNAAEKLGLSLRAMHRVMKVARTVADLDEERVVVDKHLVEALGYRGRGVR